ncbi:MAG: MBL fold metallo-hydrolase [Ignavibacteriales bacterium]|nr:MBL fold metallo-hydrolase [Ignavibacteriales bacterium]
MKRRSFVKTGILTAIGTLLISPFINNKQSSYAITKTKHTPLPERWDNNRITLSWIGHSTVLINFFGVWILTDPVLYERIGIYLLGTNWGPSRFTYPALSIDEIPQPDIMLLSHAHMDHMDYKTLKDFANKYPGKIDLITSFFTKDVIEDLPWKSIKELDWGNEHLLNGVIIKALEVKHFGWRFPWEKDRSQGFMKTGRSYNAYLLEKNGKKILFGGDTAKTDKLNFLMDKNIDVAIMPIGAYRPWKWSHCNPEEALIMADKLNAKYFIPIHTNTFQQGKEPRKEPLNWLNKSAINYKVQLGLNEIGQTFTV